MWGRCCAAGSVMVAAMSLASRASAEDDPPKPADPIEVVVEGEQLEEAPPPPGEQSLGKRDVARLPGAFSDAFRAIEAMPGVTPMAAGLPHLLVRGAPPSASGFYLDGVAVPFLFHLGVGPSVLHPALIDEVTFHPGAFGAAYGHRIGGIVSAKTSPPARRLRWEATLRLFDAGAYVEVPLADERVSVFAAGRYSYTAPLLSLFAPDTELSYWDYQSGGNVWLDDRTRVGVFAFGSRDHLGSIEEDGTKTQLFDVEFHRVTGFIELHPRARDGDPSTPAGASARASVTYGHDGSGLNAEAQTVADVMAVRGDAAVPLFSWWTLQGGMDLRIDRLGFEDNRGLPTDDDDSLNLNVARSFSSRDSAQLGAYVASVFNPTPWLEIVPGFRADLFGEPGVQQAGLDPRLAVRTRPTPWLTTVSAFGRMHQKPQLLVSIPGFDPLGLSSGLQRATQVSQSVEVVLPAELQLTVTGFYHQYDDLTDISATCSTGVDDCAVQDRADGRSFGAELLLKRSFSERVGALLAYTLSRAERTLDTHTFTADFDRTHVVHAALGVDLTAGWHAGARVAGYSGRPHSFLAFDDPSDPNEATLVGKRNALRRPPFFRLDLRVEKRWVVADMAWIGVAVEGFNVTLSKETVDFDCRVAEALGTGAGLSCGGQVIGPITIPSLTIAGGM